MAGRREPASPSRGFFSGRASSVLQRLRPGPRLQAKRIIPDRPQPYYGKTYRYLLPLDPDAPEGAVLLPLEELPELELGDELDPVLEDDESLGLVVELEPEPFVASSFRQSSFAVPLSESQRGELP